MESIRPGKEWAVSYTLLSDFLNSAYFGRGCTGFGSRSVWICGKSGANAGGIDGNFNYNNHYSRVLTGSGMIDINFYNLDEKNIKAWFEN